MNNFDGITAEEQLEQFFQTNQQEILSRLENIIVEQLEREKIELAQSLGLVPIGGAILWLGDPNKIPFNYLPLDGSSYPISSYQSFVVEFFKNSQADGGSNSQGDYFTLPTVDNYIVRVS